MTAEVARLPGARGSLRRLLRRTARILVEAGVPADVLVEDVRAGIGDAVAAHGRSGR